MTSQKPTICFVIPDSNDISGASNRDAVRTSPFFHPVFHTLLSGLRDQDEFQFEIVYGKRNPIPGEDRRDGCLHYKPVPYQPLPIPGMGGGYLGRTMALLSHIRQTRPALVHGQGTEREAGLVAALSGLPSILTLHGNFRELSKTIHAKPFSYYRLAALVERFCIPRVSAVHCLSHHAERSVSKMARQTCFIPNAVDERFFQAPRIAPDDWNILCVGAITDWKNPTLLIEAADLIQHAIPKLKIHFIGSINKAHSYGASFMDLVNQREWCNHHPHCTQEELISFYQKAACSVVPSIQDNCPTVVLESMACGVPCIGSSAGGIPDLIEDEATGWLFDSGNARQLADKLLVLHGSPAMSGAVAARALEHVKIHHSAEVIASAHLEMYSNIVPRS